MVKDRQYLLNEMAAFPQLMNWQKINLAIIAAIFVVYLFSCKGYLEVLDTQYSVQTAFSIYDHGTLDIPKSGKGSLHGMDGKIYSKYGIGFPLSFLPYVAVATALHQIAHVPRDYLLGFLLSFANIPFAIATLFLFANLLRKFELPEKTISFALVALGLGTLCWRYAAYDFSEEIQMLFLMLAVYGVVRPKGKDLVWAGVGFAGLIVFKLIFILLFPSFFLYLLFQFRGAARIPALARFIVPIIPACCFLGWVDYLRFGNPFETGYGAESHLFYPSQMWWTIAGLLVSFEKGLFVFCPILVLGFFGWRTFYRKHRPEALFCGSLILLNLLWTSAWYEWHGGWSWGPRFLVPLIPFWLLPALFYIDLPHPKRWFALMGLFLALSIFWQMPGILIKDQEIHQIKYTLSTPEQLERMPSDNTMAWIMFFHKLLHGQEIYTRADFDHTAGASSDLFDLDSYKTFRGFNIWTEQASRQVNKPILRLLPLLGLLALAGIAAAALRSGIPRKSLEQRPA
jgi:hypothetical protein